MLVKKTATHKTPTRGANTQASLGRFLAHTKKNGRINNTSKYFRKPENYNRQINVDTSHVCEKTLTASFRCRMVNIDTTIFSNTPIIIFIFKSYTRMSSNSQFKNHFTSSKYNAI